MIEIIGGVWRPIPVENEPLTRLTKWHAHRVQNLDGSWDLHFHGYAGYEGRVCSRVVEFDKEKMIGRTRSGRLYVLVGVPGANGDAEHVWGNWLHIYGNPQIEDISEELFDGGNVGIFDDICDLQLRSISTHTG